MKYLLSRLVYRGAGLVPQCCREFVYRRPALLVPLAGLLKRFSPTDGTVVVRVAAGPNRGARLAVNREVPNYFWLRGEYEPEFLAAIEAELRPGMVVADVGAHIGFTSLHMARLVGDRGRVLALEPDPRNFALLVRNCELNSLRQVTPLSVAVAGKPGTLRFSATGTTTSRLVDAEDSHTIEVRCDTLDHVLASAAAPVGLIKLDVEGAESAALRGAERLLRQDRPVWLIEVHSWENLVACRDILAAARYSILHLSGGADGDAATRERFAVCHILARPVPS